MNCPECGWPTKEVENGIATVNDRVIYHVYCNDCSLTVSVNMDKDKYFNKNKIKIVKENKNKEKGDSEEYKLRNARFFNF